MSNVSPRVSIIIATYNAAATLQECLDSITAQSFDRWEVLTADGGSTDTTLDIIHRNAKSIAWFRSAPDKGIYDAWNQAIPHARGEYVMFLGADDALRTPDALSRVFHEIGEATYDLVTGRGELVHDGTTRSHLFGKAWSHRKVQRRMTICHPGALHRRGLFDEYGLFDTSYRICADYDFILRLPEHTSSLFIDMPFARIRDAGVSRRRRAATLRESFRAQSRCPRVGPFFATLNFLDKLWRIPVAKLLGIPN